ncbi:PREDICTED: probable cytochrome P450 304a1 [Nicrophorus vespilloides]|uniref:Probable cytochrome P450 304a1 n=1 Tax=Nicrophorus vespilloides TaxID=110193 RepID=A0ABM1M2M7_NICVS|nr:PREDICTED: probable cytochrome P450 304a1 [Nicrophorus vespilloides]
MRNEVHSDINKRVEMISFSVLFVIAVVCLLVYIFNGAKKRPDNFPPGPPKLPFWGSLFHLKMENFRYPHKALMSLGKKYKTDVVGFYTGEFLVASCYKYDLVKEVMVREEFSGRPDTVIIRNRGLGRLIGIFFSDGEFWRDQRWFSLRHMRDYGFGRRDSGIEDRAAEEVRGLIEFFTSKPKPCDSDVCVERGIVKMPDVFFGPALNCIHFPLSTRHFDDYRELRTIGKAATNFLQSVDSTGSAITATPWLKYIAPEYFGWNHSFRENEILFKFVRAIIEEHKESYIEGHDRDFIDTYLSEMNYLKKNNITDTSFGEDQLMYTTLDYMFPAPVAIGHTLNFLFAHLINKPEIQVKMQEEIDQVVGRSRLPTIDDRKDLHYIEATLREMIRKDPIVPLGLGRRATKDTTLAGYFIPENTLLLPNIWAMHNDPEFWGDPENFRPERFLDSNGHLVKKDLTLGFGAGKRLCAGETFARNTMFLMVTGIMQNFTLSMPEKEKPPCTDNQVNGITVSIPDYWMKVTPRP